MKQIALLLITVTWGIVSSAQTTAKLPPRELPAKRTTKQVKIDGNLNEDAWKDAAVISDIIEFRPTFMKKEPETNKTIAYLMYDNEGIYFGGHCYESSRDSVATELKGRDGFGNNDYVGLIFDTYKDNINGFEYFVTPLGEQWDAKMSNTGNEDFSWNAVWKSAAVITKDGWSFEMFIPYSAIRFSKKDVQSWGLNITRKRVKSGQQYMWNPVDPVVSGFLTQEGYWIGLENIKPPLRLQFSPYFSVYANHEPDPKGGSGWSGQINGGMDVKYGINQSFTLDATLIPDFGQVPSDNEVLNLGPFAVQYNENRPFFTEGTELFSKGNLFYSRRIGVESAFHDYPSTGNNEVVIDDVYSPKLINATKISGRTPHGLGIGVLNAISSPTEAVILDTITKLQRTVQTNPLTNYNVFVLDQTLKHNSSVSLVNTNVWRSGSAYDANVTAALFDFNDKKNMWNFGGKVASSNLIGAGPDKKTITGYGHSLYFGKASGHFNFNIWEDLYDKRYNNSDLGYFTNNNYLTHGGHVGYNWTKPKGIYNQIYVNFNWWYNRLFSKIKPIDKMYQDAGFNFNGNMKTKKLWFFGAWVGYNFKSNDFYEPRKEGMYFKRPARLGIESWFNSNDAKKYYVSFDIYQSFTSNFYNGSSTSAFFYHSLRFNKKFSINHQLQYNPQFNDIGFTSRDGNDIVFARRKINTISNTFGGKYNFTTKMGINLHVRYYMSTVKNKEFFTLQNDGTLLNNTTFNQNTDQNYNRFTVDMLYSWEFAPGSFLYLAWKNITKYDTYGSTEENYFKNLQTTLDADQKNSFSARVIYFIDYLTLKRHRQKAKA